ncbi:MAG: HAMP domain-containing histidine kinase [Candidatus Solibacter usitatus]|nr:HAMP domain-containing histidine kinase [Candidatus Solibacter usitatus]
MFGFRRRLFAAFLITTLAPLSLTLWVTGWLVEQSLSHSMARETDELSRALEQAGHAFYREAQENLRTAVQSGRVAPRRFLLSQRASWPAEIDTFWESGEKEATQHAGEEGERLDLLVRHEQEVWRYSRSLGAMRMEQVTALLSRTRQSVESVRARDLRRGFLLTLLVVAAAAGTVALALWLIFAHRISGPVQKLTGALERLAAGDFSVRVPSGRGDEIGAAMDAFNRMAEELQHSRERLIMLTRLESWQSMGRKMAHEVKNSLTPIRLAVEEMAARQLHGPDNAFAELASRVIADEVTRLERRVRAFSDLAAEPPVHLTNVCVNSIVKERVALLRGAHPDVIYNLRLAPRDPEAVADEDLVRGVLTNLLENAAEAAGPGGVVVAITRAVRGTMSIEIHDSGPGLSLHARQTLFQPTISFKRTGMGLGLSIARKSAVLCGGDIEPVPGELGGAAFHVTLPLSSTNESETKEQVAAWAQDGF